MINVKEKGRLTEEQHILCFSYCRTVAECRVQTCAMGEKRKKLSALTGSVTPESVKIVAESVGLSELPDAALTFIADDMTFRLRHTIQV